MNNQDVGLDQLFASARNQPPETSFEDTKKRFLGALVLATGGALATKGIIHLFTKKWIIMMTIVSVATSAAIVASTVSLGDKEPVVNNNLPVITEVENEKPVGVEEKETKVFEPIQEEKAEDIDQLDRGEVSTIPVEGEMPELTYEAEVLFPPDTTDKDKKRKRKNKVKLISYSERFVVTENTTEEELEEIKKSAIESGINFSYDAEYKKGKLRELNISMNLNYEKDDRTANMSETRAIVDIEKGDEIVIGWIEDEDGHAMIIGDQDDWDCDFDFEWDQGEYMKEFERSMEEFEESMKEFENMNFAFACDSGVYVFNMDCGNWADDFEIVIPTMPEMPELDIQFQMEELEEMLENLEGVNEEALEQIEEQLEQLEEQLEQLEEMLERQKKELEEKEREREGEEDE